MSRLSAQDIAIERLRISGDHIAAHTFVRELEASSWPLQLPASLQHAWVFVRELHVSGKQQELRQHTAQQLEYLLSQSVDGRRASASSTVVRFDSLPQLLAFLVCDLALGHASGKWYWQRWNYLLQASRETAVAQLLVENIPELPAVVEQLKRMGQLHLLWQSLSSNTALKLAEQVGKHYGFRFTVPLDAQGSNPSQFVPPVFAQDSAWLRVWNGFVASTPVSDHRWLFAAAVTGISYCPVVLMRNPHSVVNAFKLHISGGDAAWFSGENSRTPVHEHVSKLHDLVAVDNKISVNEITKKDSLIASLKDGSRFEQALPVVSTIQKPFKITQQVDFSSTFTQVESIEKTLPNETVKSDSLATDIAEQPHIDSVLENTNSVVDELPNDQQFSIQTGGFFYLINAIRTVITAEFLAEQLQANAWLWWFDIARLLAQRFELTLDKSFAQFSAIILGVDDSQTLLDAPISAEGHHLLQLLDQTFAAHEFWVTGEFIPTPAQLMADASHIDIYYPLHAVRLDIRLAGLDVNPGWVPWLGRVVRFHYIDSPQLVTATHSPGASHDN